MEFRLVVKFPACEMVAADPPVEEFIVIRLVGVPLAVNVPPIVCVVPAVKVTVFGALTVKLLKVLEPEIACVEPLAPLRITVPVPAVKVPSTQFQFPPTLMVCAPALIVPV